jgi:hypothetical protein
VTLHPIKTLPDGTRVYSNGTRYKPKKIGERVYKVRKPDNPEAVRFRGEWLLPLPLLPDDERPEMPETLPDDLAYDHKWKPHRCRCRVCNRPQAVEWRKKWRRDRKRERDQMRTASP